MTELIKLGLVRHKGASLLVLVLLLLSVVVFHQAEFVLQISQKGFQASFSSKHSSHWCGKLLAGLLSVAYIIFSITLTEEVITVYVQCQVLFELELMDILTKKTARQDFVFSCPG